MDARDSAASPPGRLSNVSLARRAWNIRRHAVLMGEVQGQGYIAQALGIADVLAVAYFHAMRYRADQPEWPERDRFLLSPGHYAIALYAALIEAGVIPEGELETYGADESRLPMSGMASYTPGMEISGGSLGQGLAIGVGMALALKRKRSEAFVYCLFSDGECGEGAVWEGAAGAGHFKLDNLIGVVDYNNQQADGPASAVTGLDNLADRFTAFGWFAQRVDGNDLGAVAAAFDAARSHGEAKPRVIICDTKMAKGVAFLEARERSHFLRVEPDEWHEALVALDAARPA